MSVFSFQPAFVARFFRPTKMLHTQLSHGAITLAVALVVSLFGGLFGGMLASATVAVLYVLREKMDAHPYYRKEHYEGRIGTDVLDVHLWDSRRDWYMPVWVALAWTIAWDGAWLLVPALLLFALLIRLDDHPHRGLVVDGLY